VCSASLGERDINHIHQTEGLDAARAYHDSAKPFNAGEAQERDRPNGAERDFEARVGPSPGGEPDHPAPRFRTLREFCGEYKPIAEVIGGGVLTQAASTRSRREPGPARRHGW
jgi:hypothetical protein